MRLVERQHPFVFRLRPSPGRDYTRGDRQHLIALHHDPWESAGTLLLNVGQGSVLPSRRCSVLGKKVSRCLTYCIPLNHSKTVFSSANGVTEGS